MIVSARDLAMLFVEALNLEDVNPNQVDVSAPLFGSGLGLDSLDLLEISLVIQQKFGIKVRSEDANIADIFGSLQKLANHINSHAVLSGQAR